MRIYTLFELQILVPERVSQEVESDAVCSAFEESKMLVSALMGYASGLGEGANKNGGCEHLWW